MNLKITGLCLFLSSLLGVWGCAKDSSSLIPDTNWADITLEEKGSGKMNPGNLSSDSTGRVESYQAAKIDLYNKFITDIMNLKIDPKRDVKTFIGNNQKLKEKVTNYIKSAHITEAVYTPGKGMEVSAQLYLGEGFTSILGLIEKKPSENKKGPQPKGNLPPTTGF